MNLCALYYIFSYILSIVNKLMENSIVDASRKRRRDEEVEEELEQAFFIIVSVVSMLLSALTWYHDKYIYILITQ